MHDMSACPATSSRDEVISQDGRDHQNTGDVVIEVQKLVGTAVTDNQVPFRLHTYRQ